MNASTPALPFWRALPRAAARATVIGVTAAVAMASYGVQWMALLRVRDRVARHAAVAGLRGRVLRDAMARLGATFIKLGQVMSTRADLFAPEFIAELRRLQDQLPPFPFKAAVAIIEADLGGSLTDHFVAFEPRPVAAASVAQVHHARLHDGREVAVKVLRPDVRRRVEQDGAILLWGARLLAHHPSVRLSDPVGHLEHFIDGIMAQTDLLLEAAHYERFRGNFDGFPGIVFPQVYPDHSGPRVLTMDFIHGRKLDALDPGDHPELSDRLQQVFFKMSFGDGFLHADLHPGNLLLMPSGDVAIFDVGLAKQLDDAILEQFIDLTCCLVMGTADDVVVHMRRFHTYLGEVDWAAVRADVEEFALYFRGQNVAELEISEMFNRMFALGRKYRIQPVAEMALIIVGMITAEGLSKMLNPDINSFDSLAAYLLPIVQHRGMRFARVGEQANDEEPVDEP